MNTINIMLEYDSYYEIMKWLKSNVGTAVHSWYPHSYGVGWSLSCLNHRQLKYVYQVNIENTDLADMFKLRWAHV